MSAKLILFIRGRDFGPPSPLEPLIDATVRANPGAIVLVRDWNSRFKVEDFGLAHQITVVAHSFGGHTAVLIAAALDGKLNIDFDLILLDPVRHQWTDDPDDPSVMQENPLAQLVDRTPFKLTPNVVRCKCYLRSFPIGPLNTRLALNDIDYDNIEVPNTDHNSIVKAVAGDILRDIQGIKEAA